MGIEYRLPDNATRKEREEAAAMFKAEAAEMVATQESLQRPEVSSSAWVDDCKRRCAAAYDHLHRLKQIRATMDFAVWEAEACWQEMKRQYETAKSSTRWK